MHQISRKSVIETENNTRRENSRGLFERLSEFSTALNSFVDINFFFFFRGLSKYPSLVFDLFNLNALN